MLSFSPSFKCWHKSKTKVEDEWIPGQRACEFPIAIYCGVTVPPTQQQSGTDPQRPWSRGSRTCHTQLSPWALSLSQAVAWCSSHTHRTSPLGCLDTQCRIQTRQRATAAHCSENDIMYICACSVQCSPSDPCWWNRQPSRAYCTASKTGTLSYWTEVEYACLLAHSQNPIPATEKA